MKNENRTSFIIICSIIIISFFLTTIISNIVPRNNSKSYYANNKEDLINQLIDYSITDNTLELTVTKDIKEYCLKSTKSFPKINSVCWNTIKTNDSISLMKGKKYYLWIKNKDNSISSTVEIINK